MVLVAAQAESMPLHGTVGQLLNRLIAAGIGQRPVIFVTHRYVASAPALQLGTRCHALLVESAFMLCNCCI